MKQVILMGLFLACTLLAARKAHADAALDKALQISAHKYNVPLKILRAIAQVETKMGTTRLLHRNSNGTYDFGPLQINTVNWQTTCKHLNVATLQGNTDCGALILSQHKRAASYDAQWWARYNSKTPSVKAKYAQRVYAALNRGSN